MTDIAAGTSAETTTECPIVILLKQRRHPAEIPQMETIQIPTETPITEVVTFR